MRKKLDKLICARLILYLIIKQKYFLNKRNTKLKQMSFLSPIKHLSLPDVVRLNIFISKKINLIIFLVNLKFVVEALWKGFWF